jgi:hypothetical protein
MTWCGVHDCCSLGLYRRSGSTSVPDQSCPTPAICIYVMATRMGHSFQLIDHLSVINVTYKTVDESCKSVDVDFEQESLSASPGR